MCKVNYINMDITEEIETFIRFKHLKLKKKMVFAVKKITTNDTYETGEIILICKTRKEAMNYIEKKADCGYTYYIDKLEKMEE